MAEARDPKWITRLTLRGRGTWRGKDRPLQFLKVGHSVSSSYLWIGHGDEDAYYTSMSPAESRRLAAWLIEQFPTPLHAREATDGRS